MFTMNVYNFLTVLNYEVEVHTGSIANAATSANVYLMLVGERGDTGKRKLLNSLTPDTEKFQPGKV